MSFLTTIESDASAIEQDVVTGLKAGLNYVDNVLVTEIEPELATALQAALQTFGTTLLGQILGMLSPGAAITVPNPTPPASAEAQAVS